MLKLRWSNLYDCRRLVLLLAVAGGMVTLTSCEPPPSTGVDKALKDGTDASGEDGPARTLLNQVAEAYAKAKTYEDVGELHFEAEAEGKKEESPAYDFSVTFERPNRFRVHAFGASVLGDGKLVHATVPGIEQILTLASPVKFEAGHLMGDEILTNALSGGSAVSPLPILRLLLEDKSLAGFNAGDRLTVLPDAQFKGDTFQRVEATTSAGKTIYWIDPKSHLLRRVEFPTEEIIKKQGNVDKMKIWADFASARVDEEIDANAFTFETPDNAPLVKRLLPPPPPAPSPLLGQEVGEFTFDDFASGKPVDRSSFQGKVAVFDFWATWCGWCFRGFPNLEKVYDKFKDNEKVAIFTVDTDDTSVDDDAVKKAFADAKLHLPIARDRKDFNKEAFSVEGLPTMVVLDGNGKIQHVHVGYDPNLEKELSGVIERLLKGEDIAREALEKHEAERRKYEQELNEVLIGTQSTIEVPESKIAERSDPSHLSLEKMWAAENLPLPGNLLAIQQPNEPTVLYVLSGSKKIVQLSPSGEAVATIDLQLPKEVGVSSLRTATDAAGERYFVAFASTQQQLFLFDKSWKQLLAFPDSQHQGLSDVQLADLDGNGQPEILAGYWGIVGVQAVSLAGERVWSNRQLENVMRLAVSEAADDGRRFVLCVNGRDFITPIDYQGKAQPEVPVAGQSLGALFVADLDGALPAELCALSAGKVGVINVLGLDAKGESLWTYSLPTGIHSQPVEIVTPSSVPMSDSGAQGVWLLAAADGSIHILAADGKLVDQFNYGEELTGISTATVDDKPALIVATAKGVTAWALEFKN